MELAILLLSVMLGGAVLAGTAGYIMLALHD